MSREIVGTADFGGRFGVTEETTIAIDNIQSTDPTETFLFDDNDGSQVAIAINLLPTNFTCGFRFKLPDSAPFDAELRGVALTFADTDFAKSYVVTEYQKTKELKGWLSGSLTCIADANWDTSAIEEPVTPVTPSV